MRVRVLAISLLALAGCAAQDSKVAEPDVSAAAWEQRSPAGEPLSGEDGVIVTVTAIVESVDVPTRHVTLLVPGGEKVTLKVGPEVQRLDEIKPKDTIDIEYIESIAFEVRHPTAEEKASPAVAVLGGGRADLSNPPAGAAGGSVRQVVTVSKIDKKAGKVTVKFADGSKQTIKAKYPENLSRVKVGDTIVVTLTEAIAVGIRPKQ